MKIKHIILLAALSALSLSCEPRGGDGPCAQGAMSVVVTRMDAEDEDRISTIRFIVFGDPDADPVLETNRLFDEGEFDTGGAQGDGGVSQLGIVLEVMRRIEGPNDKLLVVIANEPPSMTSVLDAVALPEDLESLRLDFADFLNDDHHTLIDGAPLPMTAALWTDKVHADEQQAADDVVTVELRRAVARVDVYIELGDGVDPALTLSAGTTVTLGNTYDSQYFIHHFDDPRTFGSIQTVASGFLDKEWELVEDMAVSERLLLCSFYTPERTCTQPDDADKLTVSVSALTSDGAVREASAAIASAALASTGVVSAVTVVERNNVYRVTISMGAETANIWVGDWSDEDIYNEL